MSVIRWSTTDEGQVRATRTGQELILQLTVICSSLDDNLFALKLGLPQFQRWQPHPEEPGMFVDEFSATQEKGSSIWRANVRYVDTLERNPLDLPAVMTVRTETLPSATILNSRGQLILNTAGDVVQPIDKPERIRVFTFKKNVPAIAEWLFELEDAVNGSAMALASFMREPRTLLLRKVEFGEPDEANDIQFVPCVVELAYRKSGWQHRYPSIGFNELVEQRDLSPGADADGPPQIVKRAILINGQPPSEPQLLDAAGHWVEQPEPQDVVILSEDIYSEADLTVLPIR
jgi:hypothetical protein